MNRNIQAYLVFIAIVFLLISSFVTVSFLLNSFLQAGQLADSILISNDQKLLSDCANGAQFDDQQFRFKCSN